MLFCSKAFIVTILKKERTIALLLFFYFLSHLKLDIINNVSIFPFNGIYGKDILGIFVIYYCTAYKAYCDLFEVPCIIILLEPRLLV